SNFNLRPSNLLSEADPKPELHRPEVSRDWLLVLQRGALLRAERVVFHVEQVERLGNQVNLHAIGQREPLLESHVRPILHRLDKAVARDDRAVRTQPSFTTGPVAAQVAAVVGGRTVARAEVVVAAQLEALPDFPDAVGDEAMALVLRVERPRAGEIVGELERDDDRFLTRNRHQRVADAGPET